MAAFGVVICRVNMAKKYVDPMKPRVSPWFQGFGLPNEDRVLEDMERHPPPSMAYSPYDWVWDATVWVKPAESWFVAGGEAEHFARILEQALGGTYLTVPAFLAIALPTLKRLAPWGLRDAEAFAPALKRELGVGGFRDNRRRRRGR